MEILTLKNWFMKSNLLSNGTGKNLSNRLNSLLKVVKLSKETRLTTEMYSMSKTIYKIMKDLPIYPKVRLLFPKEEPVKLTGLERIIIYSKSIEPLYKRFVEIKKMKFSFKEKGSLDLFNGLKNFFEINDEKEISNGAIEVPDIEMLSGTKVTFSEILINQKKELIKKIMSQYRKSC